MFRRCTSFVLVILMLLASIFSSSAAILSKAEHYDALVNELKNYLYGEEVMPLEDMFLQFGMLGSYKMSACFALYVKILQNIEEEQYGQIRMRIQTLCLNDDFCAFLEEDEVLGSLEELECYALGRQAETSGDIATALTNYEQCSSFADTFSRLALLRDNEFSDKYEQALEYFLSDTPEGYQNAYQLFTELAELNYQDSEGYVTTCLLMLSSYGLEIPTKSEAEPESIEKAESETPSEEAANSPVEIQPVSIPASEWSDWTDQLPDNVTRDAYEIEEKTQYSSRTAQTQYRYRSLTKQYRTKKLLTTTSSSSTLSGWTNTGSRTEYGAWSAWTTTAATASGTLEVEKKTETVTKQVKTYTYRHYAYTNISENNYTYYTYADNSHLWYSTNGKWEYITTTSPLPQIAPKDGHKRYRNGTDEPKNYYYNETIGTKDVTENVTKYRTRSIKTVYTFEKWDDWTDWSTKSASASSNLQVETRTVKGNWSSWQNNYVSADSSREVDRRYTYGEYGPWQDAVIDKTAAIDVMTRTVYRYRLR